MFFDPTRFLRQEDPKGPTSEAFLVVLNQPIRSIELFRRLSFHAGATICADGGANSVFDLFSEDHRRRAQYVPHCITGDLDSIRPEVEKWFRSKDVSVVKDEDQYSTDFNKSMNIVKTYASHKDAPVDVMILGGIGGRVDQSLGVLHEIKREQDSNRKLRLHLVSEQSISFILPPGINDISLPVSQGLITKNVGIIPIYGPAVISTQGFEWDVKDWRTAMGGQVSSSNHVAADVVEVETDAQLLFTVEMESKFCA